jgi:hypothetical protein
MARAAMGRIGRYPGTQERGFVRTLTAAIITVGLVASLSACASSGAQSGDCTPTTKSGDASSLVTASGKPGSSIDVNFPTPLITKGLEVSTISEGDGRTLYPGEIADFSVTAANATTGEVIDVGLKPTDLLRRTAGEASEGTGPFGKILECATVGSRLAATMTVKSAFGQGGSEEGLGDDDTVVIVVDIARGFMGKADGAPQLAQNGMPAVVLAPNGQPGISVPAESPPKKTRTATLKQGDGAKVKEDDLVVVHTNAIVWGADSIVDDLSSWPSGVPKTYVASADRVGDKGGVLPGLAKALIGARVGSQLLVVLPPGKDSYDTTATLPSGVTAKDTLVYVIDVLGIQGQG